MTRGPCWRGLVAGPLAVAAMAAGAQPAEVAAYLERRQLCEHFRQEPWPEGASAQDRQRRAFIARQWQRYCQGSDRALADLRARYRDDAAVTALLAGFESPIETGKVSGP